MKAARFYPGRCLQIEDIPEPVPVRDEVKIEVKWCGICGSDLHQYLTLPCPGKGGSGGKIPAVTMGHEFSGVVAAVGPDCTRFRPGDRVIPESLVACGICPACRAGKPHICRHGGCIGFGSHDGGFAQYCVVPECRVHNMPEAMTFEQGAIVEPLSVAYHSLSVGRFQKGQTAVVAGAGPIGLATIACLKAMGAGLIIVVQRKSIRQEYAKTTGADLVLNPNVDDVAAKVLELTEGDGADVAFETTGAEQCFHLLGSCIKPGGCEVITSLWDQKISVDLNPFVLREKTVAGIYGYTSSDFHDVIQLLSQGKLKVPGYITKKISLDEIVPEGFGTLTGSDKKSHVKILVTPKPELLG